MSIEIHPPKRRSAVDDCNCCLGGGADLYLEVTTGENGVTRLRLCVACLADLHVKAGQALAEVASPAEPAQVRG